MSDSRETLLRENFHILYLKLENGLKNVWSDIRTFIYVAQDTDGKNITDKKMYHIRQSS